MAIVKRIYNELIGEDRKLAVKCSSKGIFSIDFPADLKEKLGTSGVCSSTLLDCIGMLDKLTESYKDFNVKRRLCVALMYGASGYYKPEGAPEIDNFSRYGASLSFDYRIVIEETYFDGSSKVFLAVRLADNMNTLKHTVVGGYVKKQRAGSLASQADYKLIDYSDEIVDKLKSAMSNMESISYGIWNIYKKDEFDIALQLSGPGVKMLG